MDESSFVYSLFLGCLTVHTLWELHQHRSSFGDAKVIKEDRNLAFKVAAFILIPIGVLLHEVGHSLATWQVGGKVAVFRWYLFSGYIIPVGDFNPVQDWWISFAGNLVSILLAILAIPLIFKVRRRIVAEVLYRFVAIESIYSLVYYPLWSAYYRDGDWMVIYGRLVQPYASLLLVAHLALLWKLWQLYKSEKMLQWRLARNSVSLASYQKLKQEQLQRPNDLQPQVDLAYFLLEYDEVEQAKKIFTAIAKDNSDSMAIAVLDLCIDYYRPSYDSLRYTKIIQSAKKLLLQDTDSENKVMLYRLLASTSYQIGKLAEALEYANSGLAIAPDNSMLLYHRAKIYARTQKYEQTVIDLESVLTTVVNEDLRQDILHLRKQCLNRIA
ncbi:MAG: M50 family metallopeptidase [Cyanobacteria bacterium J06600_6]